MKRLPQYNGGMRSDIYKYLIENDVELKLAVEEACADIGMDVTDHGYGLDDVPKNYPYIALIHPDGEFNRIDYAFVDMSDFTENSEAGSLKAELDKLYNETTMAPWMARINEAIRSDEREIAFQDLDDDANPSNQYAVNNHQIRYIKDKGYCVSWEKYPRSYIVSGW